MDESVIVEHIGLSENRLCHLNGNVNRERPDCLGRRPINRRKALCKFGARVAIDGSSEHFQDAVIELELIRGIVPGICKEQVGHAAQHRSGFD
jgi:hypothetical protein